MKAQSAVDIKYNNRRLVYEYIKNKPTQTVSRPELAKVLRLTDPTVLKISAFLLERGICQEVDKAFVSTVGRRPGLLAFQPKAAYTAGAEYDGKRLNFAVFDLNNRTVDFCSQNLKVPLERLFSDVIPHQMERIAPYREKLIGLGVALPAAVHPQSCLIQMRGPGIDCAGITDFSLQVDALGRRIGLPIVLENDVNAAAIGAHCRYRANRQDFIFLMLGLGLGAGIVLDGKLRRGRRCLAGEIGYITYDAKFHTHPEQSGYLESVLRAEYLMQNFGVDVLEDRPGGDIEGAIRHVAQQIAMSIANFTAMLDVDYFMIGGCLAEKLGIPLFEQIRAYCGQYCLYPVEISPATEPDLVACGMGVLVQEKALRRLLTDQTQAMPALA